MGDQWTDIEFDFTHAAKVFAAARNDVYGLPAAEREALDELKRDGLKDPMKLYFHTFSFHGRYNMIMTPRDGRMVVDASEPETIEAPLKEGPFAGYRVVMPRAFSE